MPETQLTQTGKEIEGFQGFREGHPNLIVALDANSSPNGHLRTIWDEKVPNHGIPPVSDRYSKIHRKQDGSIRIHATPRNRVIDDVLSFGAPAVWYVKDSKQVIPVTGIPMGGATQVHFERYYSLSDHLPIKADCDVDQTGGQ